MKFECKRPCCAGQQIYKSSTNMISTTTTTTAAAAAAFNNDQDADADAAGSSSSIKHHHRRVVCSQPVGPVRCRSTPGLCYCNLSPLTLRGVFQTLLFSTECFIRLTSICAVNKLFLKG